MNLTGAPLIGSRAPSPRSISMRVHDLKEPAAHSHHVRPSSQSISRCCGVVTSSPRQQGIKTSSPGLRPIARLIPAVHSRDAPRGPSEGAQGEKRHFNRVKNSLQHTGQSKPRVKSAPTRQNDGNYNHGRQTFLHVRAASVTIIALVTLTV